MANESFLSAHVDASRGILIDLIIEKLGSLVKIDGGATFDDRTSSSLIST